MRKNIFGIVAFGLMLILSLKAEAANFVSGSTGADGSFNPPAQVPAGTIVDGTTVTVPLPANGIFNFTTVDIPSGMTIKFQRNIANTPVYILTTGDVNIAGTIDVSGENGTDGNTGTVGAVPGGKGGPGGFNGGYGGEPSSTGVEGKLPGYGLGPGGGASGCYAPSWQYDYSAGGDGGFAYDGGNNSKCDLSRGRTYGTYTLLPLIGGSGGGGGLNNTPVYYIATYGGGGGGGGGAILIASSTLVNITVTGEIKANGGVGGVGGYSPGWNKGGNGSGGGIRLIANRIANLGNVLAMSSGLGIGRIRIESNNFINSGAIYYYPSITTPSLVFLPQIPSLQITKIAGNNVPASPTGSYTTPDITLPLTTINPISIEVAGANIPAGTSIKITATPQQGTPASATSTLTGTDLSSTATTSLDISTICPSIISAETTFTLQLAMFHEGEKIDKVRIASKAGKGSEVVYITESGKEIPAEKLLAGLMRH